MHFYLLLSISTIIIASIVFVLWGRTKNISFIFGFIFLYYWTLFGAWFIVGGKLGITAYMKFKYLEKKLFPIHLNEEYFFTILIYSSFIILIGIILIIKIKKDFSVKANPRVISHSIILTISAFMAFISYIIIKPGLNAAKSLNKSAYSVISRYDPMNESSEILTGLFTIHQLLLQVSIILATIGLVVLLSGRNPKYIVGKSTLVVKGSYIIVFFGLISFTFMLGQKGDLFIPGVIGSLFYLDNAQQPKIGLLLIMGFIGFAILGFINITRGIPIYLLIDIFPNLSFAMVSDALQTIIINAEAFGAHFSMYGILKFDMEPTYGYGLYSFIVSIIPRLFWPSRPFGVYPYYAKGVNATPGQGYSIHHVAGWYLDFGIIGVLIGAIILGLIWAKLYNSHLFNINYKSKFYYMINTFAPWIFVAYLPRLIRGGGIEAYKGLILEGILIPITLITLCSYKFIIFHKKNKKVGKQIGY
jgi:hypothetical protein